MKNKKLTIKVDNNFCIVYKSAHLLTQQYNLQYLEAVDIRIERAMVQRIGF